VLDLYEKFGKSLKIAEKVLIISHRKPDADTLGAAIALKLYLEGESKLATMACIDKPSERFKSLPCIDDFVQEFSLKDYDLVVIVDVGASYMTGFEKIYPDFLSKIVPSVNIDHHASNDNFADLNIVDVKAASATVILYKIFVHLGADISADMASALLAGIYNDTGSFMHSNTSQEVYEVAANLMQKGAQIAEMSKGMFHTNTVQSLRIWGKAMESAEITSKNVLMSAVGEDDYRAFGASAGDLSGVIDYLNMVPGAEYSVLLNEDGNGNVKGSLRTKGEIDLSKVAQGYGGGGHPKASGFVIPGQLKKDIRYKIVSEDMSKKSLEF
jgi:phosphoesterase RecJ-like protein